MGHMFQSSESGVVEWPSCKHVLTDVNHDAARPFHFAFTPDFSIEIVLLGTLDWCSQERRLIITHLSIDHGATRYTIRQTSTRAFFPLIGA